MIVNERVTSIIKISKISLGSLLFNMPNQIKSNQIKWFFSGTRLYLLQHNVNNQQKLIEK